HGMNKADDTWSARYLKVLSRAIIVFVGAADRNKFSELCFYFINDRRKRLIRFNPSRNRRS
ncbi:MAG: hypothetical protein QXY49_04395, partial [Thermofilaceae archaeon]